MCCSSMYIEYSTYPNSLIHFLSKTFNESTDPTGDPTMLGVRGDFKIPQSPTIRNFLKKKIRKFESSGKKLSKIVAK